MPGQLGRFVDDAGAGRQRCQHASRGNGDREVPRRRHEGRAHRNVRGAFESVELFGEVRVVERKIDGLRDFDVALVDGLSGFAPGDFDELAAVVLYGLGDGPQDLRPLLARARRPLFGCTGHGLDDFAGLGVGIDHVLRDDVGPEL